jgi:phosphatidylserine/phosphatidylglycerophosphate/cardiolipin synthase-like enzyme
MHAHLEEAINRLEASFVDQRLSEEERRGLTEVLREVRPLEENLRHVRKLAFAIARQHLGEDAAVQEILRWLEGVMRALDSARPAPASASHAVFFSPGQDCLNAILQRLRQAARQIDICVFTISDDRISDEIHAAHRRGVRIRLITDNEKEDDVGSDIAALRQSGIPVRVDRSTAHMHHKFALLDQSYLLNGSYNWTRSAAHSNEENLVVSKDAALVAAFSTQFEQLWSALGN